MKDCDAVTRVGFNTPLWDRFLIWLFPRQCDPWYGVEMGMDRSFAGDTPEPFESQGISIPIDVETKEIKFECITMEEEERRQEVLKKHCPKSPDGKHIMIQNDGMPLVIGITGCYNCKFGCGLHIDTWVNDQRTEGIPLEKLL